MQQEGFAESRNEMFGWKLGLQAAKFFQPQCGVEAAQ